MQARKKGIEHQRERGVWKNLGKWQKGQMEGKTTKRLLRPTDKMSEAI